MKRRDFSRTVLAFGACSGLGVVQAQEAEFREGREYVKIGKPAATLAAEGKVEVVDFFWYRCGHCKTFQPLFAQWAGKAPEHVQVRHVPVAFNASFVPEQKMYYALENLDLVESLHARIFAAVHEQRTRLIDDKGIFAWMEQQPEVDIEKFKESYNSFGVANQVRQATQLQDDYGLEGTPTVGVGGRYWTDGSHAGSMARVMQVVDHLVGVLHQA